MHLSLFWTDGSLVDKTCLWGEKNPPYLHIYNYTSEKNECPPSTMNDVGNFKMICYFNVMKDRWWLFLSNLTTKVPRPFFRQKTFKTVILNANNKNFKHLLFSHYTSMRMFEKKSETSTISITKYKQCFNFQVKKTSFFSSSLTRL